MSSSALRTFALVLFVLAFVFGALAYYVSGRDAAEGDSANAPLPEAEQLLAVVAIKPLPAYREITTDDVALVPISVAPPQYFTDVAEVVGRAPVRGLATGAPVTEDAFGRNSALSEAIPPGTQAMSLSISDVVAVGGFVRPGDFVDVLVYLRSAGDQVEDSQARILLKNARVLAYQTQLISDEGGDRSETGGARRDSTAVIAVPEQQTTRVMLGASLGELRLALRAPVDKDAGADLTQSAENDELRPQPVSPASQVVADNTAADRDASSVSDGEEQQVITLAELGKVKAEQAREQPPARRRAPSRQSPRSATIEVYEGSKAISISRPY